MKVREREQRKPEKNNSFLFYKLTKFEGLQMI